MYLSFALPSTPLFDSPSPVNKNKCQEQSLEKEASQSANIAEYLYIYNLDKILIGPAAIYQQFANDKTVSEPLVECIAECIAEYIAECTRLKIYRALLNSLIYRLSKRQVNWVYRLTSFLLNCVECVENVRPKLFSNYCYFVSKRTCRSSLIDSCKVML